MIQDNLNRTGYHNLLAEIKDFFKKETKNKIQHKQQMNRIEMRERR